MTAPKTEKAGNVRVVVRIRPLSKGEEEKGCDLSITSINQDYGESNKAGEPEVLQLSQHDSNKRWFEFDAVLGDESTQAHVYERSGAQRAVVEEIFKGYNATLLAYGQTGAGKTYTMGSAVGDEETHAGILPRACQDLFDSIQTKCDGNARVELSYLEIYNEDIRDLFSNNPNDMQQSKKKALKIRETLDGEVYVSGLESRQVTSPEQIGALLEEASKRRVTGSTAMNAVSSRSHAICTFKISGVLEGSEKFTSKLTLVDLAGSERMKKTGAEGSRAMEGIHINKSLMVLGQVVSALADRKKRKPPYRESKLTRLLQDSLGGNSRTIMLACVSPADYNVDESANTLRYATSARNIKNTATRNLVKQISPEKAAHLQRENQLLKQEVAELQEALRKLSSSPTPSVVVTDDEGEESMDTEPSSPAPHVRSLEKQLTAAKLDLRQAAEDTMIELPALKVEVAQLKEDLEEKAGVEKENEELRQEVEDARADAAGARLAAAKLSDIMEQLKELKQDEVERKRFQLQHKLKERDWVDFVARMLDTRTEQISALYDDFELVVKVVESPAVYQTQEKNGWFGRKEFQHVYDPELRERVLKEHVEFFKDRLDEIQRDIFTRVISLQSMRDKIRLHCEEMETEIGMKQLEADGIITKEQDVLAKLVHMLIDPNSDDEEEDENGVSAEPVAVAVAVEE